MNHHDFRLSRLVVVRCASIQFIAAAFILSPAIAEAQTHSRLAAGQFSAFDTIKKERIFQVKQHLDCLEKAQSLRELRACRPKNQ